ncbi:Nuclear prelamin A recognition factor [Strongyloides ratti]|uniref:Nuclear prelamin A recognition factor n=1 Tax=Strongyloides ratti TaxID=34506 RepID=A0A090LJY1_STRRB|nr:Nuclear prelamin A recognition factor [Strongyloides ratti]CEF67840.1 Nuclear prelamin A recognition factor [Strongyloides ratti]
MSKTFSGIVQISNVSDYILPSQGCIIPLATDKKKESVAEVSLKKKPSANLKDKKELKEKVKISLNDCLSCNGCVTTAEVLLIESQTTEEMLRGLLESKVSVVTLSPQSITSIAHNKNISVSDAAKLICAYFYKNGVTHVIDSSFGRYISLEKSFEEFKSIYESNSKHPVICSVCPVPYLSKVRSPQAMNALLVKNYFASKYNIETKDIYHASVMPCYDKKLEASRNDFVMDDGNREIDCVIGTNELSKLLENFNYSDNIEQNENSNNNNWLNRLKYGNVIGGISDPSGGYSKYIIHKSIESIFFDKVVYINEELKSKDLTVIEIIDTSSGKVLLTAANIFGFKNIQNVVQKIKRNKCTYDYIEVMACPSGCTNGSAQIRGEMIVDRASNLQAINSMYTSIPSLPDAEDEVKELIAEWPINKSSFDTSFHIIDSSVLNLNAVSNMF